MVYDEQLHNTAQDMKYYNVHSASKRQKKHEKRQSQKKRPSMKTFHGLIQPAPVGRQPHQEVESTQQEDCHIKR